MDIKSILYSFFYSLRVNVYENLWIVLLFSLLVTLIIVLIYSTKFKKISTSCSYISFMRLKHKINGTKYLNNSNKSRNLKIALIIFSVFLTVVYLCWRVFISLPISIGWIAVLLSVVLLLVEIVEFFDSYNITINQANVIDVDCPHIANREFPDVDVFICTYNEPISVLKKTINGCVNMEYPNKKKVHIYLCDDKNRKDVKDLAKSLSVNYLSRKENTNAKAGNLNNALKKSKSDYIAIFDADMIPKSNFLLKTIPYFVDAKKVNDKAPVKEQIPLGFVQTPQHFYQADLMQHSLNVKDKLVSEQEFFHQIVQKGKNYSNSVYCCGTNCVLSRKALSDVGGFYEDSITEDIATGILIQSSGYASLHISDVLAQGMNPSTFDSLVRQRTRWSCGCIATTNQLSFLKKKLNFFQKLSFNSVKSFWYYPIKNIIVLFLPIITSFFSLFIFQCSFIDLLLFWGIPYIFKAVTWTTIKSKKYSYVMNKATILCTSFELLIPILKESLGFSKKDFAVTTKKSNKNVSVWQMAKNSFPFVCVFFLSFIAFFFVLFSAMQKSEWSLFVLMFWLLYNAFFMMLCLYITLNEEPICTSTISTCQHKVTMSNKKHQLKSTTSRLSETYIDIFCKDFDNKKFDIAKIQFENEKKKFSVKCKYIESLTENNHRFEIQKADLQNLDYLYMLYEDENNLPNNNSSFSALLILWRSFFCRLLHIKIKEY